MSILKHKHILVGITGGIAAYKTAELVSRLKQQGAEVQVVMSQTATEFITPLTLGALSGRKVFVGKENPEEHSIGHIELSRWADSILITPASANFISRTVSGMADDLLSTLCLAATCPINIAPAMNKNMWQHPATQKNIATLKQRDVSILGPAVGNQACGEYGHGRMLEPTELLVALEKSFYSLELSGVNILVTAGPTREKIDPVRYISNRSSGKMGYATAQAAQEIGAEVTLISGPVYLTPPERIQTIHITSSQEMHSAVMSYIEKTDIFIAVAAISDYQYLTPSTQKLKRNQSKLKLELTETQDILADVAKLKTPPYMVGFAAETEALKHNALEKLNRKEIDMIAANMVGEKQGFETDENALSLFWKNGEVTLEKMPKSKLARQLIKIVAHQYKLVITPHTVLI